MVSLLTLNFCVLWLNWVFGLTSFPEMALAMLSTVSATFFGGLYVDGCGAGLRGRYTIKIILLQIGHKARCHQTMQNPIAISAHQLGLSRGSGSYRGLSYSITSSNSIGS